MSDKRISTAKAARRNYPQITPINGMIEERRNSANFFNLRMFSFLCPAQRDCEAVEVRQHGNTNIFQLPRVLAFNLIEFRGATTFWCIQEYRS
jgi:hypothetical protein